MKLIKALNNSALIVEKDGLEKVVLGKGIGFGLKPGDFVDVNKVDRIFSANSEDKNRLIALIQEIPDQYLEVSEEIIAYARGVLKKEISDTIYISLTDHLYFIFERYHQNIMPSNPFKYDVQRFYEKEYKIGKKAVELLEDEFQVKLNDDEAAAIAMHIINAEFDMDTYRSIEMLQLMEGIIQVIRYQLKIDWNEESMNFQRLMTHLKFFVQRIMLKVQYEEENPLYDAVKEQYPKAYECVLRIKEFIEKKYMFHVSKDECTYLMIHIQRLMSRETEE